MVKRFILPALMTSTFALYVLFVGCPIHRLTGLNCPFCGMTRAHFAFLRGDLQGALNYHRLFYLGVPIILGAIYLYYPKKQNKKLLFIDLVFLIVAISAIIINYLLSFIK